MLAYLYNDMWYNDLVLVNVFGTNLVKFTMAHIFYILNHALFFQFV